MTEIKDFPFNFPFKPYNIQLNLMERIYETLQNKQIGIFSSPTGILIAFILFFFLILN